MEMKLLRHWRKSEYTIGRLYVNGELWCNTIEDTVRPEGVKIPGKTAIPAGRYRVMRTYSPKFKRLMPLICNVPNFLGVRIHAGVDQNSTEGCVIPGENKLKGKVINSKYWANKIDVAVAEAENRGEECYIDIRNE